MDNVTTQRQQAVVNIRSRTSGLLGSWIRDVDAIQISVACATRTSAELLEFMLNKQHAKVAVKNTKALAIDAQEWAALFGAGAKMTSGTQIGAKMASVDKTSRMQSLASALRCTVAEKTQGCVWTRTWTRAACLVAMHMETHEETLASCLGNLVRADLRRLEDLRCDLDDDGMGVITLAQLVEALAHSVT